MFASGKNKVDFSRYVALGDSITAGYKDAALFYEGQVHCYPNLLAEQFTHSGIEFRQALMNPDSPGIGFFGNSKLVLKKAEGSSFLKLTYLRDKGDIEAISKNIYQTKGPFNNLGVPGAKCITMLAPGYGDSNRGDGNFNPYFFRIASDPEKASQLSDAMKMNPSFFSLFIGNNDVLAYALSGGTADAITPLDGPPGRGFASSLNFITDALCSNGAKGILSNLPAISSIPFFNTIHHNNLFLNLSEAATLNARFRSDGASFNAGRNSFLVEDPSNPNGMRHIQQDEFILLEIMLDENNEDYLKGLKPIPRKYYLSKSQIKEINTIIISINSMVKKMAAEKKLAFVDTNLLLKNMRPDRIYNENTLKLKYKTRGVFSLDGLHINPLGQALLANAFIKSINETYGSYIPKINITKFRGKPFE